jgi:alpha-tubulin suppressor-like RCC1 family protein
MHNADGRPDCVPSPKQSVHRSTWHHGDLMCAAWGDNRQGQTGTGQKADFIKAPTRVPDLPPIRAVAAGANHALALSRDGEVLAWGSNTVGQAGVEVLGASPLHYTNFCEPQAASVVLHSPPQYLPFCSMALVG